MAEDAGRAEPADAVGPRLGEPQGAAGAGSDAQRSRLVGQYELGDGTGWSDAADAVGRRLGEPEVAVRASGDTEGQGVAGRQLEESDGSTGAHPADAVGAEQREPEVAVRSRDDPEGGGIGAGDSELLQPWRGGPRQHARGRTSALQAGPRGAAVGGGHLAVVRIGADRIGDASSELMQRASGASPRRLADLAPWFVGALDQVEMIAVVRLALQLVTRRVAVLGAAVAAPWQQDDHHGQQGSLLSPHPGSGAVDE